MGLLMDLIAGDGREILLAVGLDDWEGLADRRRFPGHVALGGRMDPAWLDLFSRAVREATESNEPAPFTESCCPLEGPADVGERTIEKVDSHWVEAVARLPETYIDRVAGRWIDLIELEECGVDCDDKPMLRELAGEIVDFCRRAETAEDVLFAWSL